LGTCVATCSRLFLFFFSSRRRHTRFSRDWSSDVCSSDLTFAYLKSSSSKDLYFRLTRSHTPPHQKQDNSCTISFRCDIYLGSPSNPPFYPVLIPTHIYREFLLRDRSVPFLLQKSLQVVPCPSFRPTVNTAIALFFSLSYYLILYMPEPN